MSKRTDSIRSMFSTPKHDMLSADNKAPMLPRVSSGAVRSLRETFSDVEKENEELRAQIAAGQAPIDLDPHLVDPSPLADRFVEQDPLALESLMTSIREQGQEIPILVRIHPGIDGRYQSAYGHRRVQVTRELGIPVKAFVREMSDEDLVSAQGVENSAREDLTYIERAVFAARLEDAGFQRTLIQTALSVDRAEVSKLLAVARAIPDEVVTAVGRAPKAGRGRWQGLANIVKDEWALEQIRSTVRRSSFASLDTDARFVAVLSSANKSAADDPPRLSTQRIASRAGTEIARVSQTGTQVRLTISRVENERFAAFIVEKLPDLFEAYAKTGTPEENDGA